MSEMLIDQFHLIMYNNKMGNFNSRVNEIMDKIYNSNGPSNATELEEELAKKLKENFADSYKNAANDLVDPENEIPSPGSIAAYISESSEAEQTKALSIVNDWFDNLEI